jgi:hypothetical protein
MPHALFIAAQRWPKESFLEVAEDSFAFLDRETTVDNTFSPVGNNGWYSRGEARALYDQQPVEAGTMAEAALDAFRLQSGERYLYGFRRARGWFHGQNSRGEALLDVRSGGCCDGLQPGGVNRNQGAESTLAYLFTEALEAEVERSNGGERKAALAGAQRSVADFRRPDHQAV